MKRIQRILLWITAVCLFLTWNIPVYGEETSEEAGQRCNVVLFVQFPEDQQEDYFNSHSERLTYDKGSELLTGFDAYERILNGKGERNRSSLSTYIDAISEGKLKIKNVFPQYDSARIVPITMDHAVDYYDSFSGEAGFLEEAVSKAKKMISTSEKVDLNGDQTVDNLTILVHHKENYSKESVFYPHKSDSPGSLTINGKYVGPYVIINTGNLWSTVEKQGLVCHEFLHTLGLPDLYRYQNKEGVVNHPVERWDIMASSSMYMQYPLSWQRKQLGWIDLPEKNQSGTYTLYPPGTKGKNYSFIIKTPMSDTEFFVVEYRKQGDSLSEELDSKIPGSGLIIYRVDTMKEELGNVAGDDYLYVFRPENKDDLSQSFLSEEEGRTRFGSSDWSKGIRENAITFSDGSNSGIVIDQVGKAGDSISFQLTLPNYEGLALWNRIFTQTDTGRYDIVSSEKGDLYVAFENQQGIEVKKRAGNAWTAVGGRISNTYHPKLAAVGNDLYAVYAEGKEYKTVISKFENGSWNQIFKSAKAGNGQTAFIASGNSCYVVYDEEDKLQAKKVTGRSVADMGTVSGGLTAIAEPCMAMYEGKPVAVFRDVIGNKKLQVMRYDNGRWSVIKEIETKANAFSCCLNGDRLYLSSTNGTDIVLYEYDGRQWKSINTSQLPKGNGCSLSLYEGNLSMGRLEDGQKTAKFYVRKGDKWSQYGNYITKAASDSDCKFAAVGEAVYGAVNCSNGLGIFLKGKEGQGAEGSVGTAAAASTTSVEKHTSVVKPPSAKPRPKLRMTYQVAVGTKIQVTWKRSKGRAGYVVYARRGKKGVYKKIKTVKKQTKTWALLKLGKKYYFRVKPYRTVKNKKVKYDRTKKAKGKNAVNVIQAVYSNISGYQGYVLEMKTGAGKYKKVKETSRGGTIRYEKKRISLKKKYRFRLKGFRKVNGRRIYTVLSVKKR